MKYKKNLIYCTGWETFYLYDGRYYKQMSWREMHEDIWEHIRLHVDDGVINITSAMVTDIVRQMSWGCYRKQRAMYSSWLSFEDGLLNTETFEFVGHNRELISTMYIPHKYRSLDQPMPMFQKFLDSIIVGVNSKEPDTELQQLVQEMFGLMLMNTMKSAVAFFLVGGGANGKSTLTNILEHIIGEEYITSFSIESLTTNRFSSSRLVGKYVNICNEEESKYVRTDKFKNLITGETLSAERKFGDSFDFKPRVKFIFNTNNPPTFDDLNFGLRRRLIVIPFNRVFADVEQDKDLDKKLLSELPGIVNWAIEGAKRLVSRNYVFNRPEAVIRSIKALEEETSSAIAFFREFYMVIDDEISSFIDSRGVSNKEIYDDYIEWCADVNKKAMSMRKFFKDIANVEKDVEDVWVPDGHGKSVRGKNFIRRSFVESKKNDMAIFDNL